MKDIYLDSNKVKKDDYFIALKGRRDDGNKYIPQIIHKGGKLLYSDDIKSPNYYPHLKENINNILLSYYQVKISFKIIGITGTSGKSSLAFLLFQTIKKRGYKVRFVTTSTKYEDAYYSFRTTPINDELVRILLDVEKEKVDYLILEVSSVAYIEGRVNNIPFYLGILTNLKKDHLDYHHTLKNYHKAKLDFIYKCKYKVFGQKMNQEEIINQSLNILGIQQLEKDEFNTLTRLEGRDEIMNKTPLVIIDYAHTIDEFDYIVSKYRKVCLGRLVLVFGAGGNRDKSKRMEMGKIALKNGDINIVTNDNPRYEDENKIINDITRGSNLFKIIKNREAAINYALSILELNDILLIIGKGNEQYIELKGRKIPFSDHLVVNNYFKKTHLV
ncbi:MAG: Mur ligase family protein [Bacillales bacterium]|nr:Mur ligase family protein [Bacillales bacterium]